MTKTKSIIFRIRFIDLYKAPLEGLYHIVTINGRTACSGSAIAGGYSVWISRPAGTRINVSVKDPRNGSMIDVIKDLIIPIKKTTFEVQAPFAKHKIRLKMFEGSVGNYLRKTHVVKPKENLSSIAEIYGVNWQQLAQLNSLKDPYTIRPEDVLKIPPKKARQQSTNQSNSSSNFQTNDMKIATIYKVKKNETLSGISQRSGVSVEQLKRMNGITDPTTLRSVQTSKLRGGGSAQTQTNSKPSPTPRPIPKPSSDAEGGFFDGAMDAATDIAKGTVGAMGDAFESIGDGLGMLGEKAKEGLEGVSDAMSGGKNDKPAGQASAASTNSNSSTSSTSGGYTVKSGDTLGGIAQQHRIKTNDLARANGLNLTDTIHPGQKLKIPTNGATPSPQSTPSQSSNGSSNDTPIKTDTSEDRGQTGTPKVDVTTGKPPIIFPLLVKPLNDSQGILKEYDWTKNVDESGASQAIFDRNRGSTRKHAGRDLYTNINSISKASIGGKVISIAPGKVLIVRSFYSETHQVSIKHTTNDNRTFIIRYGELDPESTNHLEEGIDIDQGDLIGQTGILINKKGNPMSLVGKKNVSMLHFEYFTGKGESLDTADNLTQSGNKYSRRSDMEDPLGILLEGYRASILKQQSSVSNNNEKLDLNRVFEAIFSGEGYVDYMYLDTSKKNDKSKVTIGYGIMIPSESAATKIPFHINGTPATQSQIKQAWNKVYKSVSGINGYKYTYFKSMTTVRITKEVAKDLTMNHIKNDLSKARGAFPGFDTYPVPAQEAILDLAYNIGFEKEGIDGFHNFNRHIKNRDFASAAAESNRYQLADSRNKHVKYLLLLAAKQ